MELSSSEISNQIDEKEKEIAKQVSYVDTVCSKLSDLNISIKKLEIECENLKLEKISLQSVVRKGKSNLEMLETECDSLKRGYFMAGRRGM